MPLFIRVFCLNPIFSLIASGSFASVSSYFMSILDEIQVALDARKTLTVFINVGHKLRLVLDDCAQKVRSCPSVLNPARLPPHSQLSRWLTDV